MAKVLRKQFKNLAGFGMPSKGMLGIDQFGVNRNVEYTLGAGAESQ